jgi:hypothetical protein
MLRLVWREPNVGQRAPLEIDTWEATLKLKTAVRAGGKKLYVGNLP